MYRKFFKCFVDIIVSGVLLLLLSPVTLVLAVLIRTKLGSPVIFKQQRPGLNEKPFYVHKFRTMTNETDENGCLLPEEQRLTKTGKLIRKFSLDEIPQLFDVFVGEMSLVGPRPLLVEYIPYYTKRETLRHSCKPGITGLAQISGRNKVQWDDRLELDVQYVETISFLVDMKILWKTLLRCISSKDVLVTPGTAVKPLNIERQNINENDLC